MPERVRLVDNRPFPDVAFIPGRSGRRAPEPVVDVEAFRLELGASADFRFALDLLDFGFAWEAHAVLEALWHAVGRSGDVADVLRGLIKIAAARVKLAQGSLAGVRSHLEGARVYLALYAGSSAHPLGLDLEAVLQWVDACLAESNRLDEARDGRLSAFRFADVWSATR